MKVFPDSSVKIMLRVKCIVLSVILLSGTACSSDELWEELSRGLRNWDGVGQPSLDFPSRSCSILSIDSAQQDNDSTLTLWLHFNFDSVIVLCGLGVDYWETANSDTVLTMFEPRTDTIDFRALKNFDYRYSLRIDSLKSEAYYSFCAFLDHVVAGDTVRISGSILDSGCLALKTR